VNKVKEGLADFINMEWWRTNYHLQYEVRHQITSLFKAVILKATVSRVPLIKVTLKDKYIKPFNGQGLL
jgi:hypothetical protein